MHIINNAFIFALIKYAIMQPTLTLMVHLKTYIFTFDVEYGLEEFYQTIVRAETLDEALEKLVKDSDGVLNSIDEVKGACSEYIILHENSYSTVRNPFSIDKGETREIFKEVTIEYPIL